MRHDRLFGDTFTDVQLEESVLRAWLAMLSVKTKISGLKIVTLHLLIVGDSVRRLSENIHEPDTTSEALVERLSGLRKMEGSLEVTVKVSKGER